MPETPTEAGGQRSEPAEDALHEQMAQLAHEIEDDDVAERLIHLAAQVRTLEQTAEAGPAKALHATATTWQYGAWTDLPIKGMAQLNVAQFVTDWLRARANAAEPG